MYAACLRGLGLQHYLILILIESSKITDFLIEKMYERSEEDDQAQNTLKRAMIHKHYDKAAETIKAMNPRGYKLLFFYIYIYVCFCFMINSLIMK